MTNNIENEISGIFVTQQKMNNMDMERIVVSNPAIMKILETIKLPVENQEKAIDELVDRTPSWNDMEPEDQISKIKAVLTQETVIYYLRGFGTIRDLVDVIETGIDEEGSIVLYVYYTNMNRKQRREMEKAVSEDDKIKMSQAMLQLDQLAASGTNIIDLAQKRLAYKQAKEKKNGFSNKK